MTTTTVFLDIETIPVPADDPAWVAYVPTCRPVREAHAALAALHKAGPKRAPSNWKDPAKIAEHDAAAAVAYREAVTAAGLAVAAAAEDARRATSLDPLWGSVACVGLAVDDAEPMVVAQDEWHTELELLRVVDSMIAEVAGTRRGPVVYVAHNGTGFDVPFLRVRSIRHGLPRLARAFGSWRGKPWESPVIDTMTAWPTTGYGSRGSPASLQGIRRALGLPVQIGIDGSQVADAWHDGRRDEVIRHCREDVAGLREVYARVRDVL